MQIALLDLLVALLEVWTISAATLVEVSVEASAVVAEVSYFQIYSAALLVDALVAVAVIVAAVAVS
eukprot:TRINITY_DN1834_c0_g1_i2.p1 TRINITY_DN1834_c0_g1~~TRINITY_DN1834_c0_g1_i2.p1  ORF type:complete len:66 (+),score=13.71 TRINITY_DN1834_c0_g1_i2:304-501(+)